MHVTIGLVTPYIPEVQTSTLVGGLVLALMPACTPEKLCSSAYRLTARTWCSFKPFRSGVAEHAREAEALPALHASSLGCPAAPCGVVRRSPV